MATQFPSGTSTWVFTGGRWFPVVGASAPARFLFSVATHFKNGDRTIDAEQVGLSVEDFQALRGKFPDAVGQIGDKFTLPLVPEGTVVDITPGAQ
jgi:hypothetical protein